MKLTRFFLLCSLLAATLSVIAVGTSRGEQPHSSDGVPAMVHRSMVWSYAGPNAHVGNFSGTLVCLRCNLARGPGHAEQCSKEGHRHALSMDGGTMVHPLLAGTEEVLKQINSDAVHGKKVTLHGKDYPSTGMILVDRLTLDE